MDKIDVMAFSQLTPFYRFRLDSIFRLQLLLSPIFLVPFYMHMNEQHPYAVGVALLLAPTVYVAILLTWSVQRAERVRVFTLMQRGACYGVLFGCLSMFLALCVESSSRFPGWLSESRGLMRMALYGTSARAIIAVHPAEFAAKILSHFFGFALILLFFLLHYCLIGAAVGGVIGLLNRRDVQSASH